MKFCSVKALSIVLFFTLILIQTSCSWFRDDSEWEELFGEKKKFNANAVDFEQSYKQDKRRYAKVLARGGYLTKHVAACGSCHGMDAKDPNSALSGGRIIEDERGLIVASNITPDDKTGIGKWAIGDIIKVVHKGIDREGNNISQSMHLGYRWLSDEDVRAIAIYLKSQPAVKNSTKNERGGGINVIMGSDALEVFSKNKEYDGYIPNLSDGNVLYYGKYLANNVANCYSCHTGDVDKPFAGSEKPGIGFFTKFKDFFDVELGDIGLGNVKFGSLDREYGHQANFKKNKVENKPLEKPELVFPQLGPDIRGARKGKLKSWSEAQMIAYLSSGKTPKGKSKNGALCPWPYFKGMNQKDKQAIARYLKSVG